MPLERVEENGGDAVEDAAEVAAEAPPPPAAPAQVQLLQSATNRCRYC